MLTMTCLRKLAPAALLFLGVLPCSRNRTAFALVATSSKFLSSAAKHASSRYPALPAPARTTGAWRRCLKMDDEVARKGIKEELTTRDTYLATRFTKLSVSQHDLTPLLPSEVQEAASHLPPGQKVALFGSATGDSRERSIPDDRRGDADREYPGWRDHKEKGLYACAVGGLPLFTSGWKLDSRAEDSCPSFAQPCDEEHVIEEVDPLRGEVIHVSCARSRVRLGSVVADPESPSGKRYLISSAALEFHPLGKALPVRCQPENYWGSEGQYRAWVLE